jgi:hypothetical protein
MQVEAFVPLPVNTQKKTFRHFLQVNQKLLDWELQFGSALQQVIYPARMQLDLRIC